MAKFVVRKQTLSNHSGAAIDTFGDTTTRVGGSLTSLTSQKGHVLIGCNVANIHTATVTVDVALVDDDGGSDKVYYIAKGVSIPVGGNVELVDGKIVIDLDTTEVHAICSVDQKADIIVSILENA
tara:strand:- start:115 stop:489 length:375 start_codon:yes stop_codon:yes gene_type:complete